MAELDPAIAAAAREILDRPGTAEAIEVLAEDGECGWCSKSPTVSVSFEACNHVTPCCPRHFEEYFLGEGWESYYERPEDFDATCPACTG